MDSRLNESTTLSTQKSLAGLLCLHQILTQQRQLIELCCGGRNPEQPPRVFKRKGSFDQDSFGPLKYEQIFAHVICLFSTQSAYRDQIYIYIYMYFNLYIYTYCIATLQLWRNPAQVQGSWADEELYHFTNMRPEH